MSFLTVGRRLGAANALRLIVAAQSFLTPTAIAIAQSGIEGGFSLQARGGGGQGGSGLAGGALPWVVGVVCIALIAILVATLWPNESEGNPYQRQRKFARVDGLFLKVAGWVLGEDESKRFLTSLRETGNYDTATQRPLDGLTLMSLSFGGCSLASTVPLAKGNVVLLRLHSLPDFPKREMLVAAKVVWARPRQATGEPYDICGAKFLFTDGANGPESLRQYLNFLMDEPLS